MPASKTAIDLLALAIRNILVFGADLSQYLKEAG